MVSICWSTESGVVTAVGGGGETSKSIVDTDTTDVCLSPFVGGRKGRGVSNSPFGGSTGAVFFSGMLSVSFGGGTPTGVLDSCV